MRSDESALRAVGLTNSPDPRLLADNHGLEHAGILDVSLQAARDVLHLLGRRDLAKHRVGEQAVSDLVDTARGGIEKFRRLAVLRLGQS